MNKEKIFAKYKESHLFTSNGLKILNFLLINFTLDDFVKFNFTKMGKDIGLNAKSTTETIMDLATAKILVRKIESRRVTLFKLNPELLGE